MSEPMSFYGEYDGAAWSKFHYERQRRREETDEELFVAEQKFYQVISRYHRTEQRYIWLILHRRPRDTFGGKALWIDPSWFGAHVRGGVAFDSAEDALEVMGDYIRYDLEMNGPTEEQYERAVNGWRHKEVLT